MILQQRLAGLGGSINGRTEFHGDEAVPAFDLKLQAIMLDKPELIALKRDPTIWDRWFNERSGAAIEPADKDIKYFALNHVYENCKVTIWHALADDQSFEFDNCKLVKFKCLPAVGGLTELRCTLQSLIEDRHGIYKWMGKDIRVALEFGDLKLREREKAEAREPELQLGHPKDAAELKQVGTPEEERERAHAVERDIAQRIVDDRGGKPSRRRKANGGAAEAAA